jgi:hypothetical protein
MAKEDLIYQTITRANYEYESFWTSYPNRNIAKANLLAKLGYTQTWNLQYEGWKSVFNLINRLKIMPQYKIAYEMRRNLKERGLDADPRKNATYDRLDLLSGEQVAEFINLWQEYSANYMDNFTSVPILRCNYQIGEKTAIEGGIQWMRIFDRITETNSYSKVTKVAQITSKDNYAGYNIALMFGVNMYDFAYDINRYDSFLSTGSPYNQHYSQLFVKIYAGVK